MGRMAIWAGPFPDGDVFDLAVPIPADMAKLAGGRERICSA